MVTTIDPAHCASHAPGDWIGRKSTPLTADTAKRDLQILAKPPLQRILIVEDDGELLEVLQFVLEDGGYEVEGAPSGAAALKWIASQAIDLVILDVTMAGMSGLDVARQLRANEKTAPLLIALHTGLDEASVRAEFSDFDLFMPKGDDASHLLRLVSDVLKDLKRRPDVSPT